ncbi:MAG TPA: multidrug efflux RND transporter permease subunit [Steroidobacteraceae bacterium]|nr:multidrug efflux RND transporter permease subunit [Steroidobacteraceae bacterium]
MFSRFFIERPIFAAVVAILLCLAGAVSLAVLPVEQYPSITPITITVSATYPGADSRTLADSVAAPIEAQLNGIDNMLYMTSTSSAAGLMTLTAYFGLKTNPDTAQVQVQNRVNLALPQLPAAVTQLGVSVQKKSSSIMMLIAIHDASGRYSAEYVANYANVYVLDALKRVPGAGQASIMGVPDQAMRIWLNPDRMAALGITTTDIQQAVAGQNALFGAGQIGQAPNSGPVQLVVPVVTQRPYTRPEDYDNMILRGSPNGAAIVRLKDVARTEIGLRQYAVNTKLNGKPATFIAVYQQPGANGLDVSRAVRQEMQQLKSGFPPGLQYTVALDTNDFVRLSIEEVVHTLIEAIVLVVLVVYLFLQSFRTTLICTAAILVSLLGSFTGLLAFGFSINLLTLFGLVLAIGIVVDDAIVVVENVERIMTQEHLGPREATLKAMGEISGALVAVVLVMCSVFVPAAFLPGTTGQLYKQFAITIVVSVALSGLTALTLTPALTAIWLTHSGPPARGFVGRFFRWFNRQVERLTQAFGAAVALVIRRMMLAFVLLAVMIGALVLLFRTMPTSFVPSEDQGEVMAAIVMPDAASLDRSEAVAEHVGGLFARNAAVANVAQVTGFSLLDGGLQTNAATIFVTLKDFKERYATIASALTQNARAVLGSVYRDARLLPESIVVPISPPPIPGIGSTGGFEFWIEDTGGGDPQRLDDLAHEFLAKARERHELAGLSTTFHASALQLQADVDRERSEVLGLPIADVYRAIQAQFGSLTVSQFNEYSRVWWVVLQSDARYRQRPDDITRLYTRSSRGQMLPLASVVRTLWTSGPEVLPHFNGFAAAKINGNAASGYSSGEAIAAMEQVARDVLPSGYKFAWSGLAFEEKRSGGTSTLAFLFGLIIVFLVLAAQYESWILPAAVMTAIPFGVLGALLAVWLRGLQNDVYFQIGLLVLIGLGAKNALLRVTAAVELRSRGRSIMEATIEAGEQRLRPIIMTSLAFIFGVLPLALAVGAGANARHSIGTGIIGGMLGETTLAMLYVPLFFFIFDGLLERIGGHRPRSDAPHA